MCNECKFVDLILSMHVLRMLIGFCFIYLKILYLLFNYVHLVYICDAHVIFSKYVSSF